MFGSSGIFLIFLELLVCAMCAGVFIGRVARATSVVLVFFLQSHFFLFIWLAFCYMPSKWPLRLSSALQIFCRFLCRAARLCASQRALCGVHGRTRTGNVCRVTLPPLPLLASPPPPPHTPSFAHCAYFCDAHAYIPNHWAIRMRLINASIPVVPISVTYFAFVGFCSQTLRLTSTTPRSNCTQQRNHLNPRRYRLHIFLLNSSNNYIFMRWDWVLRTNDRNLFVHIQSAELELHKYMLSQM